MDGQWECGVSHLGTGVLWTDTGLSQNWLYSLPRGGECMLRRMSGKPSIDSWEGRFTPCTMEDGLFPWSDLMVQFTKSLGPSLGVDWMWTLHLTSERRVHDDEEDEEPHERQAIHRLLRISLHHGPWSWIMEDGLFPWSNFMLRFL